MITLNKLLELKTAQENGAVIEHGSYGGKCWHTVYDLDNLDLTVCPVVLRIQPPNFSKWILDKYEWTGEYEVPTRDNCDAWVNPKDMDTLNFWNTTRSLPNMGFYNGFRYLMREKKPAYRPYEERDEVPLDRGSFVKHKIHEDILAIENIGSNGIYFFGFEPMSFETAFDRFLWSDGTPFGVKVEEGSNIKSDDPNEGSEV